MPPEFVDKMFVTDAELSHDLTDPPCLGVVQEKITGPEDALLRWIERTLREPLNQEMLQRAEFHLRTRRGQQLLAQFRRRGSPDRIELNNRIAQSVGRQSQNRKRPPA